MKIDFEKLFNEKNIKFVEEQLEEYLPALFAQDKNLEISEKIMDLFDSVASLKNQKVMDLFIEYSNLKYEDTLHQNWLAYYIGYQKGLNKK